MLLCDWEVKQNGVCQKYIIYAIPNNNVATDVHSREKNTKSILQHTKKMKKRIVVTWYIICLNYRQVNLFSKSVMFFDLSNVSNTYYVMR
jgi:hypothetical protein